MRYIPKVDKELVVRARDGDEQAITDIVNIIHKSCFSIARSYTFANNLSSDDAEEIVQNSMLKIFKNLNSLKEDQPFSAWANVIVNNESKNYLESKGVKHENIKFSQLDSDDFDESFESTIESDYEAFEPDANMDYTVLQEGMRDCLNQLSSNERDVLYKHYYEGYKIKEIAEDLGTNTNTIKTWLRRGKENLESILVALQKKDAAFYGIGAIPFFVWMLNKELEAYTTVAKAAELEKAVLLALKGSKTGVSGGAVKAFLRTVKGKVVVSTVAALLVAGGIGLYMNISAQKVESPKVTQKTVKKKKTEMKQAENTTEETKVENTSTTEKKNHEHNWVAQYKTVHHDAVKQLQTVVDQEAYDEPVYSTRTVTKVMINNYTGKYFDSSEEALNYLVNELGITAGKGSTGPVQVEETYQSGTTHHDAVTHQEEVVVQDAYDEQILKGYKCSDCGATK